MTSSATSGAAPADVPHDSGRSRAGPGLPAGESWSYPWPSDPEAVREKRRELAALSDEIARMAAHGEAFAYRTMVRIREFDRWKGWHEEGARSCAEWLAWRTGVTPGTAREKVRVARALASLPVMSRAMERGELSYSVVRALTRVATPDREEKLVETARHSTAAQMERMVRGWKACDRAEEEWKAAEEGRHLRRELHVVPAADGSYRLHGRLDPEAGALVRQALEAAGDSLYAGEDPDEEPAPARARRADALGLLAAAALGDGLRAEVGDDAPAVGRAGRYEVVVHVTREVLAGASPSVGDDPPRIEGGPHLFPDTARRLACDAGVVEMAHDREGSVLDVGRRSRTVPAAMRRALEWRDRGCRFPGCGSRYCEAHHIHHWALGGATRLANLVLLCARHHRLVHEGGWSMEGRAPGEVRFLRPDGTELPRVPEPPPVIGDPVAALERDQRDLGIHVWTATPDWDGSAMDVDWAVHVLSGRAVEGDGSGLRAGQVSTTNNRNPSQRPKPVDGSAGTAALRADAPGRAVERVGRGGGKGGMGEC